jgi:hypothetical protein
MRPKTWESALKLNRILMKIAHVLLVVTATFTCIAILFLVPWMILASVMLLVTAIYAGNIIQRNIERCEMEISYRG